MKKAIVIGSGIGGLAVALRLRAKGYQVEVFEKNETIGGKIAVINEDGFRFDTGPSLFTLPHLVFELFELFGKFLPNYLEVVELDATCNYFFSDGSNFKAWSNRKKFENEVLNTGVSVDVLNKYLERQSFVYDQTSEFFLFNSIHKIGTYLGAAGRKSLKALSKLDAFKTMHKRNRLTFGDSNLTQLFDRYATYNGSDPFRAPATLNMIAHLEHNTGAYFPVNGMRSIVDALVKLAKEVGVKFYLNEGATQLKTENGLVTGIVTSKGEYQCDLLVNNTDITYFYKHLLPNKKMYSRLMKRERSSSALIFYWGMNYSSALDVHNIFFSKNYGDEFKGLFKTKTFANDLTVYVFISSKVVKTDAPTGKENWFVMLNAPENVGQDWAELTANARKIALLKIEGSLGVNVEQFIESEHIMTPVDIENRTASVNGSLYGHSSNSAMAAFLRHPNFSRHYKNLYFVGGSVHPGGGIPLCLASAKIVEQLLPKENI